MSPILLIVIGLVAVAVGIAAASWLARANPASVAKALRWGAIGLGVVVTAVLIAVRPQFLPFVLIFALPFFFWRRSRAGAPPWGRRRDGGAGGAESSKVETAYLRMTLEHESGAMEGEVLRGRFAGRELRALGLDDLLALREECARDDPPSVRLVESYLERTFGTDWRTRAAGPDESTKREGTGEEARQPPGPTGMTRAEALELLGLQEGADREAILAAWRRLIKAYHPDHGGSKYIAAKLNEAKRVLLGE